MYVSTDGAPFTLLLSAKAAASATFNGQIGHPCRFYSLASDKVGLLHLQVIRPARPQVAALAFDQSHQRAATALADDRVPFPVPKAALAIDHIGPPVDADAAGQFAASPGRSPPRRSHGFYPAAPVLIPLSMV